MPDFAGVMTALLQDWQGCKTPLKAEDAELSRNYGRNPLTTYRTADAAARKKLQRLFYRQILLEQIRRFARADGSNGFAVAKRLEREIPERKVLAESFREKEMSFRLDRIATASRNDAQDLAKLFRERKDPKRATETWKRWLTAQEPLRRKNGVDGLIVLADEYVKLLDDRAKAIELLKEADRISPGTPEIAEWMKRFGLYRYKNRWVTKKELKPLPVDPVQQAIRAGRVIVGMNTKQVRRAKLGPPTSVTRLASRRGFHEIWIYGKANESRQAVHFLRNKSEPRTAARVIAVNNF